MRNRRQAFTLFELVLVAAILLILATIAVPSLSGMLRKDGMTGKRGQDAAIDDLKGRLAQARTRAINEGRPYRVAYVPNKGNYRIAPDSEEFWEKSDGSSSQSGADKPLVVADNLPTGSYFCDPDSQGGSGGDADDTFLPPDKVDLGTYQNLVTFMPDGTVRETGRIGLRTVGTKTVILKLQALTGVATTEE